MVGRDQAALRVAIIAPPFYQIPPAGYGGIERVCYLLVEGLVDRGHDVTLLAAGENATRAHFVRTFDTPPGEDTGTDTLNAAMHAARVAVAVEREHFDIVHDHTILGPLTARHRTAPTLVTAHLPVAGPESHAELYAAYSGWCDLVAISRRQRSLAPDIDWAATVYNAVDVAGLPFCAEKDDYVLVLGRLSETKGVHIAIEVARRAGRRLVIAGAPTSAGERAYVETVIRPLLGPGIEWVGEVGGEEKGRLLSRARCLLSPVSWEEPFGLAMVEALACGTPVVALRAGAVEELVEDGVTGLICDDVDELVAGVDRVPAIRPQDCRDSATRRFGVDVMVAGYEESYRRALRRRG